MAYYHQATLGLVMAGGRAEYPYDTETVELTTDGEEFVPLPSLPAPIEQQCMVITDEGVIYITGGTTLVANGEKQLAYVRLYKPYCV